MTSPARVVHFEIPYDDRSRAEEFYRSVFGWDLQSWEGGDYTMVSTGPVGDQGPSEPGYIGGGMFKREEGNACPTVVLDVPDIGAALRTVEAAGGRTARGREPVGEMGWAAYFHDTEGNLIGLWETKRA